MVLAAVPRLEGQRASQGRERPRNRLHRSPLTDRRGRGGSPRPRGRWPRFIGSSDGASHFVLEGHVRPSRIGISPNDQDPCRRGRIDCKLCRLRRCAGNRACDFHGPSGPAAPSSPAPPAAPSSSASPPSASSSYSPASGAGRSTPDAVTIGPHRLRPTASQWRRSRDPLGRRSRRSSNHAPPGPGGNAMARPRHHCRRWVSTNSATACARLAGRAARRNLGLRDVTWRAPAPR